MRILKLAFAAASALTLCVAGAQAADWPEKPVKLIVFSGAGGSPDVTARLLADQLSRKWGQNFYVENKVGAGGITGLTALKNSVADGYSFGLSPASAIVISPLVFKDVPFDIEKDFLPVAFVGASPIVVAVRAESPFQTFADLVVASKNASEPVAIATPLTNSLPHLLASSLKKRAEGNMTIVPFSTSPQGVTALLRGDVVAMIDGYPSFEGMLQGGKVRNPRNLRPRAFGTDRKSARRRRDASRCCRHWMVCDLRAEGNTATGHHQPQIGDRRSVENTGVARKAEGDHCHSSGDDRARVKGFSR